MHLDVESILITTEQLQETGEELGAQITKDYKGKDLLAVCILKGSVIFSLTSYGPLICLWRRTLWQFQATATAQAQAVW